MTTLEIAQRLVELCRAGDYPTVYKELYSPDVVSVGPKGSPEEKPVQGLDAIAEKGEKWNDMMETFIDGRVSEPLVAGNFITLTMGFKCIYKGQTEESISNEVCVYEVSDGKIIKEMFFYDLDKSK